jgi:hypothetical protein
MLGLGVRPVAVALCALSLAGGAAPVFPQGRTRRAERALEYAAEVARAAKDRFGFELPEIPGEPSFLDELSRIDIDALVPLVHPDVAPASEDLPGWGGDEARAWDRVEPADRAAPGSTLRFRAERPVYQFVTYFTRGRGRSTMETGLRRAGRYRSMAERIFREEGVPTDLIWLAQVESVWKPWALSRASAKGIWQFIPSTGRRFGLDRTHWIDERADPLASTRAAARYLRFLNKYFKGNWLLALAAYNAGEGRVGRAVARAGRADFWYLYRRGFLPRETRNYVPAILAVLTIAKNPSRHGLRVNTAAPWRFDRVEVGSQVDLRVVADCSDTSLAEIWAHNPDLRRGVTPPGRYVLRVPEGARARFLRAYNRVPPSARLRRGSPVDAAYGRS